MEIKKNSSLIYILFFVLAITSRAIGQQVTDGPYVSYQGQQVVVTSIIKTDDSLKPMVKKYSKEQLVNIEFDVVPDDEPKWKFQVRLRPGIEYQPAVYEAQGKLLLISDIEGEFSHFRKLLLAAKVIDENYNWTFGNGSLVIAGDLFDRGHNVVPELWLLYKLESDAEKAGGKVHVLLGNHDIMNLSGDHRYTDAKYFKSAWLLQTDCSGLFGKDTELGRWLRSKNIVEKIGDLLLLHGGISPEVNTLNMALPDLNKRCQAFYDQGTSANKISDKALLPLFAYNTSPFWYRGYFMVPKISQEELDRTLHFYDCKRVIVGHTIVKKLNPALYYEGKVLALDVDEHNGEGRAVLMENGNWAVINDKGDKRKLKYDPGNDRISDEDIL